MTVQVGQRWKYTTIKNGHWYLIEVIELCESYCQKAVKCKFLSSSDKSFSRNGDWGMFIDMERTHQSVSFELLSGQDKPE